MKKSIALFGQPFAFRAASGVGGHCCLHLCLRCWSQSIDGVDCQGYFLGDTYLREIATMLFEGKTLSGSTSSMDVSSK